MPACLWQTEALACPHRLTNAIEDMLASIAVTGRVETNAVQPPSPFAGVSAGDIVNLTFMVDVTAGAAAYDADAASRSYMIMPDSFSLDFSSGLRVPLLTPLPNGPAMFTITKGNPRSGGFWLSTSPHSPGGVPLTLPEESPPTARSAFQANLDLGYEEGVLSSTDIRETAGRHTLKSLTRFAFCIWRRFPDNVALGFEFEAMEISLQPAEAAGTQVAADDVLH